MEVLPGDDWPSARSCLVFAVAIRSLYVAPDGGHRDLVAQMTDDSLGNHIDRFAWECLDCEGSAKFLLALVVTLSRQWAYG